MTSILVSQVVGAILAAALAVGTAYADEYDSAVAAINKLPNIKVFNLNVPNGIVLVFADPGKQKLADAATMICDALKASSAPDIKKVRFLDGPAHDKDDTIKIVETIPCK
jgi:hypothetical protein